MVVLKYMVDGNYLKTIVLAVLLNCHALPASAAISCENCPVEPASVSLEFYTQYIMQLLDIDEPVPETDSAKEPDESEPNEYDAYVAS